MSGERVCRNGVFPGARRCSVKLGSALVHAEEMIEPGAHPFDLDAFRRLASDPEVSKWSARGDGRARATAGEAMTSDAAKPASAATVHEPSFIGETILRLRAGEDAPTGYEIKRIVGYTQQPTGAGANYEEVYVVVCQQVKP